MENLAFWDNVTKSLPVSDESEYFDFEFPAEVNQEYTKGFQVAFRISKAMEEDRPVVELVALQDEFLRQVGAFNDAAESSEREDFKAAWSRVESFLDKSNRQAASNSSDTGIGLQTSSVVCSVFGRLAITSRKDPTSTDLREQEHKAPTTAAP